MTGKGKPCAFRANTVLFGNARFQFLTDRMVRMEYSRSGVFEDRATLIVVDRAFPVVSWRRDVKGNRLTLSTDGLQLTYVDDGHAFSRENLGVVFVVDGKQRRWHPGMEDRENLGGTLRTLDAMEGNLRRKKTPNPDYIPNRKGRGKTGAPGQSLTEFILVDHPVDLGQGLISRAGWALIDDTQSVALNSGWVEARAEGAEADWYFLGYGHDYKAALRDAAVLLGPQPMPPRYALGYWFSRFWAYTDQELEELADAFDRADVPLDVMVLDMDWHLEGWTGYTWDRNYFPDPDEFLADMRERGLKITLNLHPADGVRKHEAQFKDMAAALGLDCKTIETIPFDITDPRYMKAYFEILHHPEERRGVDFWWMDWQSGSRSDLKGLDPLPWINHLHWHDMLENPERGKRRPLIFSRWGGLGAGRYCIGFSGDTYSTWKSLAFQPYFTATAANVLYGYWSHDIGGHMPGVVEPELFTRWVQFGAYSPIFRTHSNKNMDAERRVWEYPAPYSHIMMEAIRKRYEQVPYVYTECRHAYDTGISLCYPMYYDWPGEESAYKARHQYMFGRSMLAAPVTEKSSDRDDMAAGHAWLPKGAWYDTARGLTLEGGALHAARYMMDETPVFVRPGAVIPGERGRRRLNHASIERLLITIFSGSEGAYTLYEDDGESVGYQRNQCATIRIVHQRKGRCWKVGIGKPQGAYRGFNSKKRVELRIEGTVPAESVRVRGRAIPFSFRPVDKDFWRYDGNTATLIVSLAARELKDGLDIGVTLAAPSLDCVEGWKGLMNRLSAVRVWSARAITLGLVLKEKRLAVDLAQAGNRISRNPAVFGDEMNRTWQRLKTLTAMLELLKRHHGGTGRQKSLGIRRPWFVAYCSKSLAILEDCRAMNACKRRGRPRRSRPAR